MIPPAININEFIFIFIPQLSSATSDLQHHTEPLCPQHCLFPGFSTPPSFLHFVLPGIIHHLSGELQDLGEDFGTFLLHQTLRHMNDARIIVAGNQPKPALISASKFHFLWLFKASSVCLGSALAPLTCRSSAGTLHCEKTTKSLREKFLGMFITDIWSSRKAPYLVREARSSA